MSQATINATENVKTTKIFGNADLLSEQQDHKELLTLIKDSLSFNDNTLSFINVQMLLILEQIRDTSLGSAYGESNFIDVNAPSSISIDSARCKNIGIVISGMEVGDVIEVNAGVGFTPFPHQLRNLQTNAVQLSITANGLYQLENFAFPNATIQLTGFVVGGNVISVSFYRMP